MIGPYGLGLVFNQAIHTMAKPGVAPLLFTIVLAHGPLMAHRLGAPNTRLDQYMLLYSRNVIRMIDIA